MGLQPGPSKDTRRGLFSTAARFDVGAQLMVLRLYSREFADGGELPVACTCDGEDRSPALQWGGAPQGTASYALIVEDPDSPDPAAATTPWVHWVLYNLPPSVTALAAGASSGALPRGAQHGLNDWKRRDYGGPCPPRGRHRYVHRLYALDRMLPPLSPATQGELLRAMQGHVLAVAQLTGVYARRD